MQASMTPELVVGVIAFLTSVILPALVALKTLRAVPEKEQPIRRAEYELHESHRTEQMGELKAQCTLLRGRIDDHEEDFKARLDGLVGVINELRVEIGKVGAVLAHIFKEQESGANRKAGR